MHTPVLKQRNAANPFERDGKQWTCNECPYILCKVLTPNRATTQQVAPTPAPAMIMICNGIAIKAFICFSWQEAILFLFFIVIYFLLLLLLFIYHCFLFIYLFIYCHYLYFLCLSCLVFDMYLPTATYFINLAFFFLLCFLFVYLN